MGCKVLLLEESEAISKNIFLTLKEHDFEVLSTNSTTEGLYILSEYDISLIIADMNIHLGKIIYFTNELNSITKNRLIPLIVLADYNDKISWDQHTKIGNWIIKPFSADKLLKTVIELSN